MRFALVTPRYGGELTAGVEHACRLLAEQLCLRFDVDVITTCARDNITWKNEYGEGADRVGGVLVRRFANNPGHDRHDVQRLYERLISSPHSRAEELEWVRRTGPWSPGLFDFLKRHHRNYDALVFFSYRCATAVHGLTIAPERSILFPWLRLEAPLRFGLTADTLRAPAAVGYFSPAEQRLARFHPRGARYEEVVGIGVQPPPQLAYPRLQQDPQDVDAETELASVPEDEEFKPHLAERGALFRRRHRLDGPIVVHSGRVEPDNGSEELIEYFDSYAAQNGTTSLVLLGVKMMKLPNEPYLRLAGVLPIRERMAAFEAADVTAAPEPDDLLAEPVLESFAAGTPVLATARNTAAAEHCRRANGGFVYSNRDEFVEMLKVLMANAELRHKLGRNGLQYIQEHFRWELVIRRFERLVERLGRGN